MIKLSQVLLSASAVTLLVACGDKGSPDVKAPDEKGGGDMKAAGDMEMPDKSADVARAAEVWTAIASYKQWPSASDAPVKGNQPHGFFIQVFYNDVAQGALSGEGAFPDGSVVIKDNHMPNEAKDGPGMLGAITVMHKEEGKWFWAKYKPDGSLHKTPAEAKMPNMPIAGTSKLKCIGCHEGSQTRDFVITKLGAN